MANYNDCIFDKIDTEDKAYFLGFFYADGYNNENRGSLVLSLHEKDVDILRQLSERLFNNKILYSIRGDAEPRLVHKSDGTPYWIKSGPMKTLQIGSRKISDKFVEYGAPQAKTFKIKFPFWLSENLWPHFIRGYFDGDGSCIKTKSNSTNPHNPFNYSVHIASNYEFCKGLESAIFKKIGINFKLTQTGKIYIAWLNGHRRIEKFLNWIYSGSTIHLKRKYERYLEIREKNMGVDSRKLYVFLSKKTQRWCARLPSKFNRKSIGKTFPTKEDAIIAVKNEIAKLEKII